MKLMIKKLWITLTFYNCIFNSCCIGGALPYLQPNQQQNQLLNRNPINSYGAPPIQSPSILGQIQSQSILNTGSHQRQQIQKTDIFQQQNKHQPQPLLLSPSPLSFAQNQHQHPQQVQRQQLIFPEVEQHQQQQHRRQPQFLSPQPPPIPRETTVIYSNKQSTQSGSGINKFQQSEVSAQQPFQIPIQSLPPLAPSPLPPLQPGPHSNRIFTTSGGIGSDEKIASNHIVVENFSTQDSEGFLTGAKNSTLYAAQLLAKSLLEASNENEANNNNEQKLDKTDLVVVKTQKKAYIIPMNLQGHHLNQTQAQELYQNRDKLPVAYTVNQFLFIIKPENVNFLNKLV